MGLIKGAEDCLFCSKNPVKPLREHRIGGEWIAGCEVGVLVRKPLPQSR